MRWQELFDDLEAQFEAARTAELSAEVADRTRAELGRLHLADRLRGSLGAELDLLLTAEVRERGVLRRVGADWLLLESGPAREVIVPLRAISLVTGLRERSAAAGTRGVIESRLGLPYVLRGLARNRARVVLVLADGVLLPGTPLRVGADFVEVADEATGTGSLRLIVTDRLVAIRRQGRDGVG
jgi:hypothetical protein